MKKLSSKELKTVHGGGNGKSAAALANAFFNSKSNRSDQAKASLLKNYLKNK